MDHPSESMEPLVDLSRRPEKLTPFNAEAAQCFSFRVPPTFSAQVNWQDPQDPLLRQVRPDHQEMDSHKGYGGDPLEEKRFIKAPGLIVKYPGRALLRVTAACPIHCRYCFRRHDASKEIPKDLHAWQPALDWIGRNPTMAEVIFSGGDPLMVTDASLYALARALEEIPHLTRLRIHTRMPTCVPERIHPALIQWLLKIRMVKMVVVHVNHPAELSQAATMALGRLVDAGIPVLNQSVLLRGVNDNVATLTALMERLILNRVQPYYLHMLDPVAGAAHFHVDADKAKRLWTALRDTLPGYAVPRLAREVPGCPSKSLVHEGEDCTTLA